MGPAITPRQVEHAQTLKRSFATRGKSPLRGGSELFKPDRWKLTDGLGMRLLQPLRAAAHPGSAQAAADRFGLDLLRLPRQQGRPDVGWILADADHFDQAFAQVLEVAVQIDPLATGGLVEAGERLHLLCRFPVQEQIIGTCHRKFRCSRVDSHLPLLTGTHLVDPGGSDAHGTKHGCSHRSDRPRRGKNLWPLLDHQPLEQIFRPADENEKMAKRSLCPSRSHVLTPSIPPRNKLVGGGWHETAQAQRAVPSLHRRASSRETMLERITPTTSCHLTVYKCVQ
jgi:hypothetical protein